MHPKKEGRYDVDECGLIDTVQYIAFVDHFYTNKKLQSCIRADNVFAKPNI